MFFVFTFMRVTPNVHVLPQGNFTYQFCLVANSVQLEDGKGSNDLLPLKIGAPPPLLVDPFKVKYFNDGPPQFHHSPKHFSLWRHIH